MATVYQVTVTSGGGTVTIPTTPTPPDIVRLDVAAPITLSNNFTLNFDSLPTASSTIICWPWGVGDVDLNGYNFSINGASFTQAQLDVPSVLICVGTPAGYIQNYTPNLGVFDSIDGQNVIDNTVPLDKLVNGTSGNIIVANGSGVWTERTMSGDATIDPAGALFIANNVISNNHINTGAAIARTKLASGTASHVVINDGSGVFSSEAQLATSRGGLGVNASAANGFVTFSAGAATIGSITEVIRVDVSFETGWQGTYYVTVPYACTVTAAKARVVKAIAGTDDATVQLRNNGGTNMTSGLITIPASSAHGTGVSVSPSANNTLTAGQEIQLVVAKTTAGGACSVDITITRLA